MALPVAPLGSLPSMNLGHSASIVQAEPAWHKALTAFLVNTAGSTGKDLVSNALATDYGEAARAQGLVGAPAEGAEKQSFASKVLHGPEWDKTRLKEAQQAKTEQTRFDTQTKHWAEQLGLSKDQLAAMKTQHEVENARQMVSLAQGQQKIDEERAARSAVEDRLNRQLATQTSQDAQKLEQAENQFNLKAAMAPYEAAHLQSQTLTPEQRMQIAAAGAGATVQGKKDLQAETFQRLMEFLQQQQQQPRR